MVRYKEKTPFPLAAIASILLVVACGDMEVSTTTTPTVTTSPIGSISSTSASAGGEVTDDGGSSMIGRGVCWNTGGEPSIDDDCTLDGSGVGEFESTLRGLVEDTGYYVRAYAVNSQGVAYGGEVRFHTDTSPSETPSLATVITIAVFSITDNSVLVDAEVVKDGDAAVESRGVCWSTSQEPDLDDDCIAQGDGVGGYTSSIVGLEADTQYSVRAYATNEVGTAYGDELGFATNEVVVDEVIPAVITSSISSISMNAAQSGGDVVDQGSSAVTARGVCWSTGQSPDTGDECSSDGGGAGVYESTITALDSGTQYFVRAYATNEAGTAYGDQRIFTTTVEEPESCGFVTDIDGHTYDSVRIGEQCWLAENLRTTRYRNGDEIHNERNPAEWLNLTTGAWANYDNSESNDSVYGKLYNWYAVNDGRGICPSGWRVPSDDDFKVLEAGLGMPSDELDATGHRGADQGVGVKLKDTGNSLWREPISDPDHSYYNPDFVPATNESGFSGVPNGNLNALDTTHDGPGFYSLWRDKDLWTSTSSGDTAFMRALSFNQNSVFRTSTPKQYGLAVRCVQ